ncbi:unnamed protein product [Enterobius vermicularis]|uniref:CASPASE_P20 domain-containing protein n=1 Tax=Enterobius vermicularis TaxID=51028 RepID=A0A3P6I6J9_ENTVE|nr:unnamed protein product [Enterobius vermicularis]
MKNLLVESIDNNNGNCPSPAFFDEKEVYRNFSSPRGLALIINNRVFKEMVERVGTEVDGRNLENLFSQLCYQLCVLKDLTAKEMLQAIQSFARRREHGLLDSCVVCVLTHGENDKLFGVDDKPLSVHEFVSQLNAINCPPLAQKPKIFILQACRGGMHFSCLRLLVLYLLINGFCQFDAIVFRLPVEADFLIACATVPGYVSWRNNIRGSWFIQSICEVFAKFAKQLEIVDMLTLVNRRVAEEYESSRDSYKQIPECSTRLRKKFFFFPGL